MPSRIPLPRLVTLSALAVTAVVPPFVAGPADAAGRTVPVATSAQLQSAIATAQPGDEISLAAGTYTGPFTVTTSGTAAAPVRIVSAGTGAVTVTANLPMPACDATGPDTDRTFQFIRGASHWVIAGLSIDGGVSISSKNADAAQDWMSARVKSGDWQARRAVPGRGANDPAAARSAVAYLSSQVNQTIVPSDDIQLAGNTITKKGVFGRLTRYGLLDGNTITDIACGTGPAVWLPNFSDGWTIRDNSISRVAASTASHYMQEGIRLGSGSGYNVVTNNTVSDLASGGRAFTTDVDASWNVFRNNVADGVEIGFNDQQSGWGNVWDHNTARSYRTAGFSFRMEDGKLATPSLDTSTNGATVTCNTATSGVSLQAGALMNTTFGSNAFTTVKINPRLQSYWGQQGNTWNGSSSAPPATVSPSLSGC